MFSCGPQYIPDEHADGSDDQMHPPAEELLAFGGAIATLCSSTHLAAAARPSPFTDGDGQAINDEDLTDDREGADGINTHVQQIGVLMQEAYKAQITDLPGGRNVPSGITQA